MEELRSTDILDKEIESDARKKAEQILKSADEECRKILSLVEQRLSEARKEKQALYEKKIEHYAKDIDASLPLEKQRFKASFIGESVSAAVDEYLKNLGQEKRLLLALSLLDRFMPVIGEKKVSAYVYGFDPEKVKPLLSKKLSGQLASCGQLKNAPQSERKTEINEGIIIEADDKSFRCRMTVEELVSEIQDKYAGELAESLFGGRIPE